MITVIFIICIFLFFYIKTRKEWKKQNKEWENIGIVSEEAIVTGKIQRIMSEVQTFYHNKKIHIVTLIVKSGSKQIKILQRSPFKGQSVEIHYKKDDEITCIGKWKDGVFLSNRIE